MDALVARRRAPLAARSRRAPVAVHVGAVDTMLPALMPADAAVTTVWAVAVCGPEEHASTALVPAGSENVVVVLKTMAEGG
jgi:hypothetical protein